MIRDEEIAELFKERAFIDAAISTRQAEMRYLLDRMKTVNERIDKFRYEQQEEVEKCSST